MLSESTLKEVPLVLLLTNRFYLLISENAFLRFATPCCLEMVFSTFFCDATFQHSDCLLDYCCCGLSLDAKPLCNHAMTCTFRIYLVGTQYIHTIGIYINVIKKNFSQGSKQCSAMIPPNLSHFYQANTSLVYGNIKKVSTSCLLFNTFRVKSFVSQYKK